MTYDPNIPAAPTNLDVSQAEINTNFSELNTQFAVNHGAFNASSDQGKHKFVTFVERANTAEDPPNPKKDEVILFQSEDNAGQAELYVKQNDPSGTNAQTYQFTKTGIPFVGMKPQAAVNFPRRSGTGAVTPASSYNVASVNQDADGRFTITYTNSIKDDDGNPTNNYFWSIQGFDDSSNPVFGTPKVTSTYTDAVNSLRIVVEFRNQDGTRITTLTRASVIIWSVQ
jgi:hypothetical protein